MGITPFPSEERVGDYRTRGEKSATRGTSGKRTDARIDRKSVNVRPTCSARPTYAEIVRKVVKSKEGVRNSK